MIHPRMTTALATLAALGAAPALAQTEIQFWHAMGGQLGERTEALAEAFNDSQDAFVVVPSYRGNYTETLTAAIAAFRAGEQPDIVQVFEVGTATMMAAEGAVKPVYEIMAEAEIDWSDDAYLPAVKSYYSTPDNRMLSLPFNSSSPVMWYNADLLAEAGVAVPTTWDEMFAAADALKAVGHDCAFSFGWQSWVMIENYLAWHDQPMGTQENGFAGIDTEFVFHESETLTNLLQRVADATADGTFKYAGRRGDSLPLFTSGECAMWMNSSAYYGSMVEQAEFEFGQAMLPLDTAAAEAPQNSIIGGATLWALEGATAEEYQGVAEFFAFLSRPEVQAEWHQGTGYVPITTAASDLSREQGFYEENPGTDTAIQQLSLNEPTPNSKGLRFGNFVQVRDVINEELEGLWAGDQTAAEALTNAAQRGNALLRDFEDANS